MTYNPSDLFSRASYSQYGRSRSSRSNPDATDPRGRDQRGVGLGARRKSDTRSTPRTVGPRGYTRKDRSTGSRSTSASTAAANRQYASTRSTPQQEEKSTWDNIKDGIVNLFNFSGGSTKPKPPVRVDPASIYTGPKFKPFIPDTSNFGDDSIKDMTPNIFKGMGFSVYQDLNPDQPTTLPTIDNPTLDTFGVTRGFARSPAGLMAPPSTEVPANMDPLTRSLSQAMLPTAPEPEVPTAKYEIQRGDTLSEIAEATGTTVEQLKRINNIKDINKIVAGKDIEIPIKRVQDKEIVTKAKSMEDLKPVKASYDPDSEFYQSGIPLDQRIYEPETGFEGMGPDPSVGQGIMSPTSTRLTAEQRAALSDLGSDVMRTNLQKITNSRGNYSQTALENAVDKGIRNTTKRALLKGAVETEIGNRGLITEGTGYRLNRAYEMFNDDVVNEALASLSDREQRRILRGAASDALGIAIMDRSYDGGSEYRGRGLVQLTHRRNYQAVEDILKSNGINIDLVNNPDLANDTQYALPIAMAYLEHAGLDDTTAENSSTKDLNNRINPGANRAIAEDRWDNVVQALRDSGQDEEADRMENRNEYTAQETAGTEVDGIIGPNSRTAMREWLNERNITIPQNATDMDLVVLVNENS